MRLFNRKPLSLLYWSSRLIICKNCGHEAHCGNPLRKAIDRFYDAVPEFRGIEKAKEICDTFPEGAITEGDKKLIKMIIRG